ncbi:NACHT domain-containing protein [Phaeovulum sp. W22_SRMD_FR3]|uniref:NACHT domain-containing protein n=1 Tax=Phaeovulum sp. W22_SRMD_FR3 TaxID=3240274 RepID=UPI003F9E2167
MSIILYASTFVIFFLVALVLWMRWRMTVSKGRFALTIVSALLTCLFFGVAAVSSNVPKLVVSKISEILGYGPVDDTPPSVLVLVLTIVAMMLIYRFGSTSVVNWTAPVRVSEIDLAEKFLENNVLALSIEQIKFILKGQKDPLASDAMVNWNKKVSEPPPPVPTRNLLKDMLVSAYAEIRISDDGWRDEGKLWVGEILGVRSRDTKSVIAFVCDARPEKAELEAKIEELQSKSVDLNDFRFFALYLSNGHCGNDDKYFDIAGTAVTVISSRQLILKSLDLLNYARDIVDSFERTRVGGTLTTLQGSYVDLEAERRSEKGDLEAEYVSKRLNDWLMQDTRENIVITGEYGQGKSTALLKFCYDWARKFIDSGEIEGRIPLLIELRGQNPSETDPLGFLSPWCARYRLLPQQVLNLIKAGEAVIIFEGFDELRNAGRAFYRHQHFNALWRFAYPGTKIIFTGRPNFFLDQHEANRTLRTQDERKITGAAFTSVWKLRKLNLEQIIDACRSYDGDAKEGIAAAAESSAEFLDIVSRPSMLPVVATIWDDISELQKVGAPLTGAALIEKYIQAAFSRKEVELERDTILYDAPSGSRYLVLPKQVRELLTICVAWRMSGLGAKNTIPRSEINDMVRELYDTLLATSKSVGVSATVAEGLIEFERRFGDDSLAERVEVITAEICSAGLLVPDPAGGASNLRFPHKQFFEFLIAKGVAIKACSDHPHASRLIERSSAETNVAMRLNSEPNAISYLAECIGTNFDKIAPVKRRFHMRVAILQVILIERFLRFISKKMSAAFLKNFYMKAGGSFGSYLSVRTAIRRNFYIFTWGGPIGMLAILMTSAASYFGFGSGIHIESADSASLVSLEFISIFSIIYISLIFILSPVLLLAGDPMFETMLVNFFRAHWKRQGVVPNDFIDELRLASLSLARGKVQFGRCYTDDAEYSHFLYPALEFGKVEIKLKSGHGH